MSFVLVAPLRPGNVAYIDARCRRRCPASMVAGVAGHARGWSGRVGLSPGSGQRRRVGVGRVRLTDVVLGHGGIDRQLVEPVDFRQRRFDAWSRGRGPRWSGSCLPASSAFSAVVASTLSVGLAGGDARAEDEDQQRDHGDVNRPADHPRRNVLLDEPFLRGLLGRLHPPDHGTCRSRRFTVGAGRALAFLSLTVRLLGRVWSRLRLPHQK